MRPAWPNVVGTDALQLLLDFGRQTRDLRKFEFVRNPATLGIAKPVDLPLLLCDVAGIFGFGLDGVKNAVDGLFAQSFSNSAGKRGDLRFWTPQPLKQCRMVVERIECGLISISFRTRSFWSCLRRYKFQRSSFTKPASRPSGVNRSSALSMRKCSRNSAREVNIR